MKRIGINIIGWIICWYVSLTCLWAQSLILEQVRIHTDRDLYASGETIWLKLYATDALTFRPTSLSAIAYVELWDVQGEILFQTKVSLDKGLGIAAIDIPPGQKTGEYLIRAYTRWMANGSPDDFAFQPIIIFDPEQPVPLRDTSQMPSGFAKILESSPAGTISEIPVKPLAIELSLSRTSAGPREQVTLEIITKDARGNPVSADLSASVARAFPTGQLILSPYLRTTIPDERQNPEASQLPDLYGLNLSGSVINHLGEGIGGARVFFCLPGKIPVVRFTGSTPEGWFRFLLPDLYGNQEIVVAATDVNGKKLQVRLDTDILGGRPRLPDWSLTFPEDAAEELQEYILQYQIQQAYQSGIPEASNKEETTPNPFYQTADQVYRLDEYTRFSMEETFQEIVYSVALRKRQAEVSARVYNTNTGQVMEGEPLLMIDGVPVPEMGQILALPSKEVERIEVLTYPYYLYGQVYDGIIHAVTFQGDAANVSIPAGAVRRPFAFLSPKRSLPNSQPEQDERIPDMRRVLLWEPVIRTNAEGKANISFLTSDIDGLFEIQVQGLTSEGLWGEKQMELKVVRKAP